MGHGMANFTKASKDTKIYDTSDEIIENIISALNNNHKEEAFKLMKGYKIKGHKLKKEFIEEIYDDNLSEDKNRRNS